MLTFYAALADVQRSLLSGSSGPRNRAGTFVDSVDLDSAVAAVPGFLDWLERAAPPPLARPEIGVDRRAGGDWNDLMRERLAGDRADAEESEIVRTFVIEAVLQPFAEEAATARRDDAPARGPDSSRLGALAARCPICGGLPAVASLREEGQGSKRTLVCALCFTEWDYVRVRCASCGEERSDALPISRRTPRFRTHGSTDAIRARRTSRPSISRRTGWPSRWSTISRALPWICGRASAVTAGFARTCSGSSF